LVGRFEKEGIDLLVIDQNIDTSTSTDRLMFNMLASIAELEKGRWEYELTFQYRDNEDLESQIYNLTVEMSREAE